MKMQQQVEQSKKDFIKIEDKIDKSISLIKSVKSIYIIQRILLHLDEKKKLDILKYNKNIQKQIGIDIEYFKKISGKYKIKEKNGIEKVYALDTNLILFEGKYLNSKKNGEGNEYKDGKLIFEGEYLNGKKDKKGKEYNNDGELIFEGEYKNGLRNGDGKEYNNKFMHLYHSYNYEDFKDKLIFEGKYKNGQRWSGKEYSNEGYLIYEGEYKNGQRLSGKEYYNKGNLIIYEGTYLEGRRWNGKFYYQKYSYETYEGEYVDVRLSCKQYINNKLVFEGEYLNYKRNGKGKEYKNDKLILEGKYKIKKEMVKVKNIKMIY